MKNTTHIPNRSLLLFLLEDVTPEEKKRIKDHLHGCAICRKSLRTEKHFLHLIQTSRRVELSEVSMENVRLRLKQSLREGSSRRVRTSFWDWIRLPVTSTRPVFQLATVLIVFTLGLILGQNIAPGRSSSKALAREAVQLLNSYLPVGNLSILPSDRSPGHVKIQFSAVKQLSLEGSVNDPDIQYILSYALVNESQDNIRLKTVNLLEEFSDDEIIQDALIHALKNDTNPGVRLKAIRILRRLPVSKTIQKILFYAFFKDTNTGIRTEAAQALNMMDDPKVQSILARKADEDEYMKSLLIRDSDNPSIPQNRQL